MVEKKVDFKKQGARNRAKGARFERKVREVLENQRWVVAKWQNNIDLVEDKMIAAKMGRFGTNQSGFPDFIAMRDMGPGLHHVIGVESKTNGYLDKDEKLKCRWLLNRNVFSKILIVSKGDKRGEMLCQDFEDYGKKETKRKK